MSVFGLSYSKVIQQCQNGVCERALQGLDPSVWSLRRLTCLGSAVINKLRGHISGCIRNLPCCVTEPKTHVASDKIHLVSAKSHTHSERGLKFPPEPPEEGFPLVVRTRPRPKCIGSTAAAPVMWALLCHCAR